MKEMVKFTIKEYVLITFGSILTGMGLVVFLTPARIAAGGVSGLSVILFHLFGWDPGIMIFILSIPIFVLGIYVFGSRFGLKSLYGTLILSASVSLSGLLLGYEGILTAGDRLDILLAALFGGILSGFGIGVVMKGGANTGGTDIIAQVIHHYTRIPLGTALNIVDGIIILISAAVFGIEIALFAFITLFTTGQVINMVTSGANYAKMAFIISDEYETIKPLLLHDMGLGATTIDSRGMYTDDQKKMIMMVVRNRKISEVMNVVKTHDPNAFMIITSAQEVLGEGFMPIHPKKS
jgi:uncharacterized membrane-anchored protein YitT (DUF2179 family)